MNFVNEKVQQILDNGKIVEYEKPQETIHYTYSHEQIMDMLEYSDISWDIKNDIKGSMDGIYQAIYNMIVKDYENKFEILNFIDYPDQFGDGYNFIVSIFQKHIDTIKT